MGNSNSEVNQSVLISTRSRYAIVVLFFVIASLGRTRTLRKTTVIDESTRTLRKTTVTDASTTAVDSTSGATEVAKIELEATKKELEEMQKKLEATQKELDAAALKIQVSDAKAEEAPVKSQQQRVKAKGDTAEKLREMGLEPIYSPELHASDPWKSELFQRLDRIRVGCGELCQLNSVEEILKHATVVQGAHLPMVTVPNVDCPAILGMEELDAGDTTTPSIPEELLDFFTLQNAYHVSGHPKRRDIYLGGESEKKLWSTGNVWTKEGVQDLVASVADGTVKGSYGEEATTIVRDKLKEIDMKGKSVLVIGSSHPWVEAICLLHGAAKVTTLEYGKIESQHPQIFTLTPEEFRGKYLTGELEMFDGIVSHSSLEHSGLGRYGDALNPWGDILAVARAWCVTKQGGFMYLGLPTGKDLIMSNWHRTYGKIRWPLVAANWRPLDNSGEYELTRGLWKAQGHGGYGFIFRKEGPSEETTEV